MAKSTQLPPETKEKMEELLKTVKSAAELKRVQSVLLGSQKISSIVIATIVGLSPEYIRELWRQYRVEGEIALLGEKRGGRHNAHLSLEEEEEFLKPFLSAAQKAGIMIVSQVHEAYEEKYKRKVKPSVIYHLLHRHGWRKIVPRKYHPKADKEKQQTFRDFFPSSNSHG